MAYKDNLSINTTIPTADVGFAGGLPNPNIPDRNNHGMNILMGLIQLGFPLDQALELALQEQGPDANDPQWNELCPGTIGSTGGMTGIGVHGYDPT